MLKKANNELLPCNLTTYDIAFKIVLIGDKGIIRYKLYSRRQVNVTKPYL